MRNKVFLFFIISLLGGLGLFFTDTKVEAKLSSLTDLGYFHWADQVKTPADNTFILHYTDETTVEPISGIANSSYVAVNHNSDTSQALVKHLGFFKGQEVNLRVTLQRNNPNLAGGTMYLDKQDFLRIYIDGEMTVTFDFLDNEQQPLDVETTFNYYGLNQNKFIGFLSPETLIKGLYANRPTNIKYDVADGGPDNYWVYFKNPTGGGTWGVDPRLNFEITTKPVSTIKFMIHNNDKTTSSLQYRTDFLAEPEFPTAYGVTSRFDKADQQIYLKAQQTIPNIWNWDKDKEMEIEIFPEDTLATQQYVIKDVQVKNLHGEDLKDLFSISQDSLGHVHIKAQNLADPRLYDTILLYYLNLGWQGIQHPVATDLIQKGYLPLPFSIQTRLADQNLGLQGGQSLVRYQGKVIVKFLDEEGQELHQPLIDTGMITTQFDVTQAYPKITGYIPEKDTTKDQGLYLPEDQTIIHRYRKAKPLCLELLGQGDPLYLSRFTFDRDLDFNISGEDGAKLTLMASCGDQRIVLANFHHGSDNGFKAHVHFNPDRDWLGQKVAFYLQDSAGHNSNEIIRQLLPETGPKLHLPERISFGTHEIPAMDDHLAIDGDSQLQIKDVSQLDHSHWQLKLAFGQSLSANSMILEKRLVFTDFAGKRLTINDQPQVIWQGQGADELELKDHLHLQIRPSDSTGAYQGTLKWEFADAPL